jgi:hypothetical protein
MGHKKINRFGRTRRRKKLDYRYAYDFLTHAIWHCQWGSEPQDREPTDADMEAVGILTDLRSRVMREATEAQ